jgi:hypothetical protein
VFSINPHGMVLIRGQLELIMILVQLEFITIIKTCKKCIIYFLFFKMNRNIEKIVFFMLKFIDNMSNGTRSFDHNTERIKTLSSLS